MLVLSRKENQRVLFPNLGIAIEILRISGNAVRVGVDAPDDVRIIRDELQPIEKTIGTRVDGREQRHAFRNRLNSANLALHLLQKQLDAGKLKDAEKTLASALDSFGELDRLALNKITGPTIKDTKSTRRALVVEDNPNERELFSGYLRLCGFAVDAVEDGVAAMNYLTQETCPDAVLLDMQMPRMDGPRTISAIRRKPEFSDLKLFAVSGMQQDTAAVPLGKRGVDRWFSKPINPVEFAKQLELELKEPVAAV